MKTAAFLLVVSLLVPPRILRQEEEQEQDSPDGRSAVTRFFADEGEHLAKELEGSWMLLDYVDPLAPVLDGAASGFATFHGGFLTWMLAIDSAEDTLFGLREFLILESGAYRYHIDEQTNLQLAAVMSFTNNTDEGNVERDPPGVAFEYFTKLEEDVLELRDSAGIVLSFRKVAAGEFPDSAGRKIEKQRSGTPSWEEAEEDR